jgi:deazaflavin-dependent oxidoreductase (nitroreductase family)
MARAYRLGFWRRLINRVICALLRLGVNLPHTYLLRVRGRKSGQVYATPVTLVEENGRRWLVAPYGEVNWVRNARIAGQVTLSRGRRSETVEITEVAASDAAPVLKRYLTQVAVVRPFFDVTPRSDLHDFVAEASRHPVFRIAGRRQPNR